MKKSYLRYFTLLLAFCFTTSVLTAQTFVNGAATGANDGTSWADAYTDLGAALTNTTTGEVWVAAGTYSPGTDSLSTFLISNAIDVYGGFNGTEAALTDRNVAANTTTLSGDPLDNDIPDDFTTNKEDNNRHVVIVDSLIAGAARVDGFVITEGFANINDGQDGAGILAFSPVMVDNCTFTQNSASGGSGIGLDPATGFGSAVGSMITNSTFSNNFAADNAAGIYILGQEQITVDNCTFNSNTTNRGTVYPIFSADVTISNCTFTNNANSGGVGGAMWNWQSVGLNITDCEFTGNSAEGGGVIYYDGRDNLDINLDDVVFTNCTFNNNVATVDNGGAIWSWRGSYTVEGCTFAGNSAPSVGSHILNSGSVRSVLVNNSTFDGGASGFGGQIALFGDTATFTYTNSTFMNGTAGSGGGSVLVAFGSQAIIDNCVFDNNVAGSGGALWAQNLGSGFTVSNTTFSDNGDGTTTFGGSMLLGFQTANTFDNCTWEGNASTLGGGIFVQNDTTSVTVTNSTFDSNAATDNGGAIQFNGAGTHMVDGCTFTSNTADFGGAVGAAQFSDFADQTMSLSIANSTFDFNVAQTQAAGINIGDVNDLLIWNNLFTNNINLSDATAGGALSLNAGDTATANINLIHNTFVGNEAPIGSGIATFTGTMSSVLNLTMQNNLMDNDVNYEVEDGTPTVISAGGNFLSDDSATELTDATDMLSVSDFGFVDADNEDFRLESTSIAVNAGTPSIVTVDLLGVERDATPDAGAYEFDFANSLKETVVPNAGQLKVLPNPVAEVLTFELTNEWKGEMNVRIYDVQGRLLQGFKVNKADDVLLQSTNVSNLARGVYDIIITDSNQAVVQKFVKL